MLRSNYRHASRGRRTFSGAKSTTHNRSFHKRRTSGARPSSGYRQGGTQGRSKRRMPTFDPSQFINKNPVATDVEAYEPSHKFSDFALDTRILNTLEKLGHTEPTPIQDQVIPLILEGKDVVGIAETGTGKTAAFLLPLIERTRKKPHEQTLILVPTRELAIQVENELRKLTPGLHFYSTVCVGGTNINPQIRNLRRTNHFIIGTPGRVIDLLERRALRTDGIKNVVLDEADRMLDMGFIHDMRHILGEVSKDRLTLFFSATMNDKAQALVHDFMKAPVTVSVKKREVTNNVLQDVVHFAHHNKFETLLNLLKSEAFERVLIFGAMKHSVEKLAKELVVNGVNAESIHGNKSHGQRQQALNKFKSGNAKVLVATDVAARGIHVDAVSHVINYDLPNTFEDYVHRIGRTGRANAIGQALTFIPG